MKGKEHISGKDELASYKILDTLPEKEYDDIADIASQICKTPISLISFLDAKRQFFKAHQGLDRQETPIDQSFCLHAVKSKEEILIVEDARKDPRFSDNPLVKGEPQIVFYAGVPLFTLSGNALGALCVIDTKPRKFNKGQKTALKVLADQVVKLLELRKKHFELEETKKILQEEKDRLNNIIEATQVGTFEWDLETDKVRINSRWAEILGYTLEELLPVTMDTWYELIHPDDVAHSDEAIKNCLDKKTAFYDVEIRMIHKEGHEVWINDRGRVVKWSGDEKPLLMSGTHTDITERKMEAGELDRTLISLKERIKEQQCLHQITQLRNSGYDVSTFLEKAAEILPSGWKYSHLATVQIEYGQEIFSTPNFHPSPWNQAVTCTTEEGKTMKITVAYQEEVPYLEEGPFYKEEYQLLEIIVQNICIYIDQKVSSNQLKSSNQKIQDLISTIDGIVWEADAKNFKMTYVSPKVSSILGYTAEAWKSEPHFWENHIHPEDKEKVIDHTHKAIKKERNHNMEYRMLASDGRVVWFNDMVTINKKDGEPTLLRGLMVDVTQQKVAEKELQLSEQRFRSLVQNGNDLIAILDFEANYLYVSPTSATILGIPPQDFIGKNAFDFIHPDDEKSVLSYFSDLKISPRISIPPFRFKHQDGTWRWIETVVTNMMDDPSIKGIVANSRDITQKIISERKLRQSEKRFKALVQEGADLTAILNLEGEYLYVSPNYPQILGFSENELIGKNSLAFFHPDDLEKIELEFQEMANEKRIKSSPYRYKNKRGGWCWLQSVATNLMEDEAIRGIVINSVDITQLIETQEKLKTSEARYRGFYESQTNFVIRTDLEGKYSYVNKKFIEDFGWIYPDGKIIGKSSMPSICEYDHQRVIEMVAKCMSNPEKVYKIEIDKPRKGGGTVTTLWDFICMVDGDGNPQEIQCMGIDISDRIKFERALQKSNERYEYVNRATNDAIFDWDLVNDQIEWGEGFYRMFGYREGEEISKSADWAKLKHPLELESNQKKWDAFMAEKNDFRWYEESRLRKADGAYLETEEIGFLLRDDWGNPLRMIGVLRDISEIKKEETQKLIKRELADIFKEEKGLQDSFREVLEYLTDFGEYKVAEIWLIGSDKANLNLTCSYANDKSLNSFFCSEGAITKVKKGEGLPGKVWDSLKAEVWDGLDSHGLFLRRKEAEISGLQSGLGLPLLHHDEPVGVLVFFSDQRIKGRMNDLFLPIGNYLGSEIKRKQQEEEMFLMFQSAPEILAIASPKGHFTKVNPAFCDILGYEEEEIISKPFELFLHPEDIAGSHKEFAETILGKCKAKNYINRYRTKSGRYRWISWNSSDPFGDEGFVFAYGYDITEMKELQNLHDNATQLARVGSWEIDIASKEVYLSKISREICNIDEHEDLELESVIAFYRDDVREFVAHTINKAIQSGAGWDFELPLIDALGSEIWVRNIGESEFREGKCVRLYGSLQDIHNRKVLEQELARKNDLLSAISKVIGTFLQTEDWYLALEEVFEITGNIAQVDRVYYFENHLDPETKALLCSQRFEWSNEQVSSEIDNPDFQNIDVREFSEFIGPLEKGLPYQLIVSDLPYGLRLKELLEAQGNKSCLILPIMMDNRFSGFIGFDDCTKERKWTESEISFLQNISSNLSAAIQRRNSQLSLQKAFDEKNAILESIGEAFFALDKEWKVLYWNKNAEKLMGMNREEILGANLWEKFPFAKDMRFYPEYVNAIKTQQPVSFEEYYNPANIWLEVNASPSDEGISVFFRDITERKLAAEQVRQSNERFEKISEATNDAIWDFDVEKNRLMWGKGFTSLFGYDLEKIKPDFDFLLSLIHPEDRERVGQKIGEFMESTTLTNWFEEYRFLMADGYYAFVMDRAVFIRNNEGKVSRVVGAMTDISYRKEYEESLQALNEQLEQHARELEISNKELEQFAYVASHDLQEPLRMVSSFIGLLERRYGNVLDEKAHQYINFAVGGAKRMRQIILDLLEFSRVGKSDDGLKIIALDEVLDEVCLLQRKRIAEKGATIEYGDLPTLITYRAPMMQIFQNLIENSLRYSSDDQAPRIRITSQLKDNHWLFAVQDNGIGIDPQFHDKIFIIFQSLHNKEKYGGTGMGLAIVKKIIENFGGRIWVNSEEGKGSTFYFTLPKAALKPEVDHPEILNHNHRK